MLDILYSLGNKKLPKDTIIINITSALDCSSSKLGLCPYPTKCYAKYPERTRKNVLSFRNRQTVVWDNTSAKDLAEQIKAISKNKKYVRFQESGDFRTQDDVDKMSTIANLLVGVIPCYTYTARKDLDFKNVSPNLTINGNSFMVHNEYRAVKILGQGKICLRDCSKCNLCTRKENNIIQTTLK